MEKCLRLVVLLAAALLWAQAANAANIAILRPTSASPAIAEAQFRIQGELLALGIEVPIADRRSSDGVY